MVLIENVNVFVEELKKLYRKSADPKRKTSVSVTFKKFIPKRLKPISEKLRLRGVPPRKHAVVPEKMKNQGILVRACDGYKRKISTIIHSKNEMKNFEAAYIKFYRDFIVEVRSRDEVKEEDGKGKQEEETEGEEES